MMNLSGSKECTVKWQYRTILFEFQKDGLLGDKYIDDEDVESTLNEQGARGWELVNVALVQEGLLAFFKRSVAGVPVNSMVETVDDAHPGAPAAPETSAVSAEQLQQQEREHIARLESQRRETMAALDDDLVGSIKIS
jgi:hypothetical protein